MKCISFTPFETLMVAPKIAAKHEVFSWLTITAQSGLGVW